MTNYNHKSFDDRLRKRFEQEKDSLEVVTDLRSMVKKANTIFQKQGDSAVFEEWLRPTVDDYFMSKPGFVDQLQQSVRSTFDIGDRLLDNLTHSLYRDLNRHGLVSEEFQRHYLVKEACDNTKPKKFKQGVQTKKTRLSKRQRKQVVEPEPCLFVKPHLPSVRTYVLGSEFITGNLEYYITDDWTLDNLVSACPECEGNVKVWSTANRIVPVSSDVVAFIDSRLKSDGRRNAKLTEVICATPERLYEQRLIEERQTKKGRRGKKRRKDQDDENCDKKPRNLDDDYAFHIVMKDIEKMLGMQYRTGKKRDNKRYPVIGFIDHYLNETSQTGRKNRACLDKMRIPLPENITLNQELAYAMFCLIAEKLDKESIAPVGRGLDNYIIIPEERWNEKRGVAEYWRGLRARARIQGRPIEPQIISIEEYEAGYNPKSIKFHRSYELKEQERQRRQWGDAEIIINAALNRHFNRGRK
ncbi:hypothetical protein ACFL96_06000 [Thermoproteota archaeon]